MDILFIEIAIVVFISTFAILFVMMLLNYVRPFPSQRFGKILHSFQLASYGTYWGRIALQFGGHTLRGNAYDSLHVSEHGTWFYNFFGHRVFLSFGEIATVISERERLTPFPHDTIIVTSSSGKKYWFCFRFPNSYYPSAPKENFPFLLRLLQQKGVSLDDQLVKRSHLSS